MAGTKLRRSSRGPDVTLNGKIILVCGGAGFVGSNFIHYILGKYPKAKIVNLDKLTYSGNLDNLRELAGDKRYTFVRGDIADKKKINAVFKKYTPHYVINFAAETHVDRSIHVGALEFINTNIVGVYNLDPSRFFGLIKNGVQRLVAVIDQANGDGFFGVVNNFY